MSAPPAVARATPWSRPIALLAALLSLGLLAFLLRELDASALREALIALPAWAWPAAVLGLWGSYALRALRLHAEWAPRTHASVLDCLQLQLAHNAAVNLVPLRLGEASYAWLIHRHWNVPLREAAASLLWLRLQDLAVLGAFALCLLAPWPVPWRAALALALLVAAALLVRSTGRTAWICALANWSLKLLVIGLLLCALAGLPPLQGLRGALAGELAAVLPLQGPAGLGTYEAAVWAGAALFETTGLSRVAGAALAVHVFALLVSASSAAAWSLWRATPAIKERSTP